MELVNDFKKLKGLKEAVYFKKEVLNIVDEEQEIVVDEVVAAMKQIIKPYIYADEGELWQPVIFEEVEIDGTRL